jgi:hypothetical protein
MYYAVTSGFESAVTVIDVIPLREKWTIRDAHDWTSIFKNLMGAIAFKKVSNMQ